MRELIYAYPGSSFRIGLATMLTGIAVVILGGVVTLAGLGVFGLLAGLAGLGLTFLGSSDMVQRPNAPRPTR